VSDQHESGPLPELTPKQEATVRRLLAEARHDEPLPVDVGDRLDRVLADLSSDSPDRSTRVVDLAARRRRRNAGGLLVAAAAVIVGGFAVGQMISVSSSDSGEDSAGSSVERDQTANDQPAEAAPSTATDGGGVGADSSELAKSLPLELTSKNLEQDVERQLRRLSAAANVDAASPEALATYGTKFSCVAASPSPYGIGRLFPAYYDGIPTVLALRPATGDSQQAEVLECGTGAPLRTVTVPAP
jgi:hypothetical protein